MFCEAHAACQDDLDTQFYHFPLGKRICKGIFSLRSTSSIANAISLQKQQQIKFSVSPQLLVCIYRIIDSEI